MPPAGIDLFVSKDATTSASCCLTQAWAGSPWRRSCQITHDPAKGRLLAERGAELAVADLMDFASVVRALSQAQGACLVSPSHYRREDDRRCRGFRKNHLFEQRVAAAGLPTVFLRFIHFMEDAHPLVSRALRGGVLPRFLLPSQRAPPLAAADVGSTAATAIA